MVKEATTRSFPVLSYSHAVLALSETKVLHNSKESLLSKCTKNEIINLPANNQSINSIKTQWVEGKLE